MVEVTMMLNFVMSRERNPLAKVHADWFNKALSINMTP